MPSTIKGYAILRDAKLPWVAGSPVAFLVATPCWPPDRCAAGLVFLWGAEAREGRHLGALRWCFCPQAQAWTLVS